MIVYGGFNIHDYIHVYGNYFKLNKSERTLIIDTKEIMIIEGKEN